MRIAILDLGTNTFHCLIVSVSAKGELTRLFKSKSVVKLGEGIHQGYIYPEAFERGLTAIRHYHSIIQEHHAEKILGFATSAARSTSNGKEFIDRIREETGIEVKIISGDREAELIWNGVSHCVDMDEKPALIMDIGGGSTEFIIADKQKLFWKHSFELGASRLLQMFSPSDPITEVEHDELIRYFENVLEPLFEQVNIYKPQRLIGSSGSFDTFAEMIGFRFHGRNVIKDKVHYDFQLEDYFKLHELLLPSTIHQRKQMRGLIKLRVDLIVIASILTNFVISRTGIERMTLSKYALKEGALFETIKQ